MNEPKPTTPKYTPPDDKKLGKFAQEFSSAHGEKDAEFMYGIKNLMHIAAKAAANKLNRNSENEEQT